MERTRGKTVNPEKAGQSKALPDSPEKEDPGDGKVKWRKVGGGTFRMSKNRIIKPNQVFMARLDEIPKQFRDVIVPVTPLPPEEVLKTVDQKYTVKADKTPGWYNVFDGRGKQVNERRMKQDDAASLVAALDGEKEIAGKCTVKPDKSAGWFNVFDETGKQLNTRRMRKAAAEVLARGPE